MKKLIKLFLPLLIIGVIFQVTGGFKSLFQPSTVRAFGDLTVDFHVPAGTPIFNLTNMVPGDVQVRTVDVNNGASISHIVALKGLKTGGVGVVPLIEGILQIVILDGAVPVYGLGSPTGLKTIQDFLNDSSTIDGIILGTITPSGHKTYNLVVNFPSSAGNEYQGKSVVLDLTFGSVEARNVVINEVYYLVDKDHGSDSQKDRDEEENDREKRGRKNDQRDGRGDDRGEKKGLNNEWVELYNPTDHEISLKNWSITDNSGKPTVIHANKKISAGGYALIIKDNSNIKYWKKKTGAKIIELGSNIGDGLDNKGDHLILKNNQGQEIDRMSWGNDTSGFNPPATNPLVPLGSSTGRITSGFDSDKASDWQAKKPPTPGY